MAEPIWRTKCFAYLDMIETCYFGFFEMVDYKYEVDFQKFNMVDLRST